MIIFIFIANIATIVLLSIIIAMIKRKPITKISIGDKTASGVYHMDARHEKAIQDKIEVDE